MPDNLFACPRCDTPLAELRCAACRIDFPTLDAVICLSVEPAAAIAEWRVRWRRALAELETREAQARAGVDATDTMAETRARLERVAHACAEQRSILERWLKVLGETTVVARETYLALRTRLPGNMGLLSYEANVFRDWAWGERENAIAVEAITSAVGTAPIARLLVLGAGAGRLAYDLHQALVPDTTIAVDLNPLPLLIASRVAAGSIEPFWEFPLAPRTLEDVARRRELRAPAPARPGLQFVMADVMRLPIVAGGFDLVVTPWLLDVVDAPIDGLLARINTCLSIGGRWVDHGSMAFRGPHEADWLTAGELSAFARASGFSEPIVQERSMPYLASPASRHARQELVATSTATKLADRVRPARHSNLPEWLVTGRDPIPLEALRTQVTTTRINAWVLGLIDGQRSVVDIGQLLERERLMPADDAIAAVRRMLITLVEEARNPSAL
jgi:hypothetical protein